MPEVWETMNSIDFYQIVVSMPPVIHKILFFYKNVPSKNEISLGSFQRGLLLFLLDCKTLQSLFYMGTNMNLRDRTLEEGFLNIFDQEMTPLPFFFVMVTTVLRGSCVPQNTVWEAAWQPVPVWATQYIFKPLWPYRLCCDSLSAVVVQRQPQIKHGQINGYGCVSVTLYL